MKNLGLLIPVIAICAMVSSCTTTGNEAAATTATDRSETAAQPRPPANPSLPAPHSMHGGY